MTAKLDHRLEATIGPVRESDAQARDRASSYALAETVEPLGNLGTRDGRRGAAPEQLPAIEPGCRGADQAVSHRVDKLLHGRLGCGNTDRSRSNAGRHHRERLDGEGRGQLGKPIAVCEVEWSSRPTGSPDRVSRRANATSSYQIDRDLGGHRPRLHRRRDRRVDGQRRQRGDDIAHLRPGCVHPDPTHPTSHRPGQLKSILLWRVLSTGVPQGEDSLTLRRHARPHEGRRHTLGQHASDHTEGLRRRRASRPDAYRSGRGVLFRRGRPAGGPGPEDSAVGPAERDGAVGIAPDQAACRRSAPPYRPTTCPFATFESRHRINAMKASSAPGRPGQLFDRTFLVSDGRLVHSLGDLSTGWGARGWSGSSRVGGWLWLAALRSNTCSPCYGEGVGVTVILCTALTSRPAPDSCPRNPGYEAPSRR